MNPEVNAIVTAIPKENSEQIAELFDENHLLGEDSIISKWDDDLSEGRVSGFRFQRDGYDCHVQIILNAEVIRKDRPKQECSGRNYSLLAALKRLLENDDDPPSRNCPASEDWDYAVKAIQEVDPNWVEPSRP